MIESRSTIRSVVCSVDWVLIFRSVRTDLGERSKRGSRRELQRKRENYWIDDRWFEDFPSVADCKKNVVVKIKMERKQSRK